MKMKTLHRILSLLLVSVLLAAVALGTIACKAKKPQGPDDKGTAEQNTVSFTFVAVMKDGSEKSESITTSEKTVGAALLAKGIIAGEDSQYGLYVKTVYGQTLDYATDGMYWAFYENGTYASKGVDSTDIVPGATYMFKAES